MALALYYYWGHLDYDRALDELTPLLALQPNNSELIYMVAGPQRRSGRFSQAAANFAKASDLDPLGWSPAHEAGWTYVALRQYDLAERYLARWQAIGQGLPWFLAYVRLMRGSPAKEVGAWLETRGFSFDEVIAWAAHGQSYGAAGRSLVRALCGNCQEAVQLVRLDDPDWLRRGDRTWRYYVAKGVLYGSMQQPELSSTYFDSAAVELEALVPQRDSPPPVLAYVYAALGRGEAAMRAAEEAARSLPVEQDAWRGIGNEYLFAETFVTAGEYELALDKLEWLLSVPSWASVGILQADPIWDPLRDNPRFQALLAKYEN